MYRRTALLLACLGMTACLALDEPDSPADDSRVAEQSLVFGPIVHATWNAEGRTLDLQVSDLSPGERGMAFVGTRSQGDGTCVGGGSVCLSLDNIRGRRHEVFGDDQGDAALSIPLRGVRGGGDVCAQLVTRQGVSNLACARASRPEVVPEVVRPKFLQENDHCATFEDLSACAAAGCFISAEGDCAAGLDCADVPLEYCTETTGCSVVNGDYCVGSTLQTGCDQRFSEAACGASAPYCSWFLGHCVRNGEHVSVPRDACASLNPWECSWESECELLGDRCASRPTAARVAIEEQIAQCAALDSPIDCIRAGCMFNDEGVCEADYACDGLDQNECGEFSACLWRTGDPGECYDSPFVNRCSDRTNSVSCGYATRGCIWFINECITFPAIEVTDSSECPLLPPGSCSTEPLCHVTEIGCLAPSSPAACAFTSSNSCDLLEECVAEGEGCVTLSESCRALDEESCESESLCVLGDLGCRTDCGAASNAADCSDAGCQWYDTYCDWSCNGYRSEEGCLLDGAGHCEWNPYLGCRNAP